MATTTQQTMQQTQAPTYKYGPQCTHITMTRIFTKEFRCCVCHQLGPFGWLYRCTQDRELMIEDDVDQGYLTMDDLGNIFERPLMPSKRGPFARRSKYSFFKEVSEDQLKTYSDDQVEKVLKQRGHAIESAAGSTSHPNSCADSLLGPLQDASSRVSMSKSSGRRGEKPWVPIRGTECQFKCCHRCRHTYSERTWLSLDGIADNDVPWTAVTGFGFHLMKSRPVSRVEHVKNLGLRPNPKPLTKKELGEALMIAYRPSESEGLGIFTEEEEGEDHTAANTTPFSSPGLPIPAVTTTTTSSPGLSDGPGYDPSVQNTFAQLIQRSPDLNLKFNTPPPEPLLHVQAPNLAETPPSPLSSTFSGTLKLGNKTSLLSFAGDDMELVDLEDVEARRPLTPMEKDEAEEGVFGKMPLKVGDGVAIMEEGVEGHWADLKYPRVSSTELQESEQKS
ncbi:hypothetical protein BJ875DRAFT_541200 [Amylocarpus encephaloides]|uniref:Uncharacterized protein n=1 Tax=Amylocarpus encephaloides TaxID=45428 RepID=A0A9P7YN28_9HELO|nr:hypothetical protein BJ875DRAFT_541200 [Amylocarpus encephaloides]